MKQVVYKFLDNHVGKGYRHGEVVRLFDPFTFEPKLYVRFSSNGGTDIIRLILHVPGVVIQSDSRLIETIMGFIPVDEIDCHSYIISWFCDRNDIKRNDLILNFQKENEKLFPIS